jgi:hypothetical protein
MIRRAEGAHRNLRAPPARTGLRAAIVQTFHVWLPSIRRCRGDIAAASPMRKSAMTFLARLDAFPR